MPVQKKISNINSKSNNNKRLIDRANQSDYCIMLNKSYYSIHDGSQQGTFQNLRRGKIAFFKSYASAQKPI